MGEQAKVKKTLPEGWREVRINEACKVITSPVDKKTADGELPVKLCNYTDVYYNNFIDSSIKFMTATAKPQEIEKFSLMEGDVIITKDSETPDDIGVPSYVNEAIENLLCGYHLTILRPKKPTVGKYVGYALCSPRIKHNFYRFANGITRFGLTSESYQKIKIPLPPLSEQKAIAALLEKWDTAIEKTESLIEAKERRFKWLLKRLINDQQDNPEWRQVGLGEVTEVIVGQSPKGVFYNEISEGMPFYQGKTEFGEIYLRKPKKWTTQITKIAEAGDILMSVRAPVGTINLAHNKICIGRGLAGIRVQNIERMFLFFYLQLIQERIIGNGGSVFDSITKNQVEKISIPLPPLTEQKHIATILDAAQKETALLKSLTEQYRIQKRGLMQKLLTGEWRVMPEIAQDEESE